MPDEGTRTPTAPRIQRTYAVEINGLRLHVLSEEGGHVIRASYTDDHGHTQAHCGPFYGLGDLEPLARWSTLLVTDHSLHERDLMLALDAMGVLCAHTPGDSHAG